MSVAGRLTQALNSALQAAQGVAPNAYLDFMRHAAAAVDVAEGSIPALRPAIDDLIQVTATRNFAVDAAAVNTFLQKLGEAHFWTLCHANGALLQRLPERRNVRTPDFRWTTSAGEMHFEVKTLSVVGGERGIGDALECAFAAQVDLEQQRSNGARVATATSVVAPYAGKEKAGKLLTSVIDTLLEKARGNIKQDQFALPNTFLVLDLGMLPPSRTGRETLRPVHWDTAMFGAPVTGEMWMLAFGQEGMLIHSVPEFEGKPGIEGVFGKRGILVDPHFAFVSGLLLVVHPLGAPAEFRGLFRAKDVTRWCDHSPHACEQVLTMVGSSWNDDLDSRGFDLT